MDRCKFRGRRVDNGEWVYGYYWYDPVVEGDYIMYPVENLGNIHLLSEEVHPDTVGAYTGLKETCTGDIITFVPSDGSTKVKQKATILYDENRACFMADSNAWYIPLHKCQKIEIIGTIHDNKTN